VFVAIDGPKNAGKTMAVALLPGLLGDVGRPVVRTKKPTPAFRLANEEHHAGRDLAELIARDRARHVREVIEPALAAGRVLVSDRYIASPGWPTRTACSVPVTARRPGWCRPETGSVVI
jgi:dTMP kinase